FRNSGRELRVASQSSFVRGFWFTLGRSVLAWRRLVLLWLAVRPRFAFAGVAGLGLFVLYQIQEFRWIVQGHKPHQPLDRLPFATKDDRNAPAARVNAQRILKRVGGMDISAGKADNGVAVGQAAARRVAGF